MPSPMQTVGPLSFFMTVGQISDYTGAAALLDDLPTVQWLLGERGYADFEFANSNYSGSTLESAFVNGSSHSA